MYHAIVQAGALALAALGLPPGEVEVVVIGERTRLHFQGRAEANGSPVGGPVPQPNERPEVAPGHWRWFSPAEEAVIRACLDGGWHTAEALAQATGESYTTEFRALLRNLVARAVLTSTTSKGYRINRDCVPGEAAG